MRRTIGLLAAFFAASIAFADSYYFGIGINDYVTPTDENGEALRDDDGNVVNIDLNGCVNDVHFYERFFAQYASVKPENSTVLVDQQATGANVVEQLRALLAKLKPGDHFYFSYSGHGTQIPGGNEPDGKEEYIVLQDLVLLHDDVFKELSDILKVSGVNCTFVFDSCFSGGMSMDTPKFQKVRRRSVVFKSMHGVRKAQTKTGRALVANNKKLSTKKRSMADGQVLFFFASLEDQTSADVTLHDGTSHGAFTMFLEDVLKEDPQISTSDAQSKVNALLERAELAQRATSSTSTPERKRRPIPG